MNEPNETIRRQATNDHINRSTTILYVSGNDKRWNAGMKNLLSILQQDSVDEYDKDNLSKTLKLLYKNRSDKDKRFRIKFSLWCIEQYYPTWQKDHPEDTTIKECIEAMREYVRGEISHRELEMRSVPVRLLDLINYSSEDAVIITSVITGAIGACSHCARGFWGRDNSIRIAQKNQLIKMLKEEQG